MEAVTPFAVMFTVVSVAILEVVVVKLTEEAPAGTVTEPGTVTPAVSDESASATPPVGALPVRVAVPTEVKPPTTGFVAKVTLVGIGGTIGSAKRWLTPQALAEMLAVSLLVTG